MTAQTVDQSVRERLLNAAFECFLVNDYHQVSTRMIAQQAGANVSMIRYYFFNKEGLYQEMLLQALQPLLSILDKQSIKEDPQHFLSECYQLLSQQEGLTKLMLKALSVDRGPGRDVIDKMLAKVINHSELSSGSTTEGKQAQGVAKMTLLSFIFTPILLKDVFEKNSEYDLNASFLDQFALASAQLLSGKSCALERLSS